MLAGEGTLWGSIFGHEVIGYQRSARTRLPCVSIFKTRKKKTNASNNWDWWRFKRLLFLTALSSSRYLKPPALPEVADSFVIGFYKDFAPERGWLSQLQVVIRHRAERGAGDVGGVFRQHAARVAGRGFLPRLAAGGQFLSGNGQRQFALLGVNGDGVAVLHQRNRPAHVSLRRDVPDDEAVAAAGKPSVGDERHVLAESLAHDGRGRRQHFANTGWS